MPRDKREEKVNKSRSSIFEVVIDALCYLPLFILFSAFFSACVEWLGIYNNWWDKVGVLHSQEMIRAELKYLNVRLEKNFLDSLSGVSVKDVFDNSVKLLMDGFEWLGLLKYGTHTDQVVSLGDYIGAGVNMVLLVSLRFIVFLFSLPQWLLFGYVGFTIGLVERQKRIAGAGREHGSVFKAAKRLLVPSIGVCLFVYLAWPEVIDPVFVITPFAILFGVVTMYFSAFYRKYI